MPMQEKYGFKSTLALHKHFTEYVEYASEASRKFLKGTPKKMDYLWAHREFHQSQWFHYIVDISNYRQRRYTVDKSKGRFK